ncbi:hypothetical protein [Pengzhenrongella sicca]|uniref:Uncharacterized protein n=1 Tax=Pengzhenrongella sicca TaxID=2819238 RepID=A0A8A4ZAP6_9MICO|nr:hypothetical protein [Pengzhenrongella sicca]QTE28495.1 hypothetical protein J4E96_14090 [Pengzhenrongella sicca]
MNPIATSFVALVLAAGWAVGAAAPESGAVDAVLTIQGGIGCCRGTF